MAKLSGLYFLPDDKSIDGKQKLSYACLMNNSALPHGLAAGSRRGASRRQGKRRAKILAAKIQRNPLISLDSDERIQGNPRKSNSDPRGFSRPNGGGTRKPKLTAVATPGARPSLRGAIGRPEGRPSRDRLWRRSNPENVGRPAAPGSPRRAHRASFRTPYGGASSR
jgi:hypothetical protein